MNNELLPQVIDNFRCHLMRSSESIKFAYKVYENETNSREHDFSVSFDDYFYDWAQANWELLVERIICSPNESLQVYGSGSDYEADIRSRVFFHKAEATHNIICLSKTSSMLDSITGKEIDLSMFDFEAFVSLSGKWFDLSPPLDHILLTEKGAVGSDYLQVVVPVNQIEFIARKI